MVLFGLDLTKSNSCFLLLNSFSGRNTTGNILCSYQLHPNNEMIFGLSSMKKKDLSMKHHIPLYCFFLKNVNRFINLLNYNSSKGSNNKEIASCFFLVTDKV